MFFCIASRLYVYNGNIMYDYHYVTFIDKVYNVYYSIVIYLL